MQGYSYKTETGSDDFGDYVISNVAAPETYSIRIDNKNYFIDDTIKISVKPFETAICNFKVYQKPVVMVKLIDKKNKIIKEYDLETKIECKNSTSTSTRPVNLKGTNEWHRANVWNIQNYNSKLSLRAKTDSDEDAYKENILCNKPGINYIVLKTENNSKIIAAGFIYSPDNQPLIDGNVYGYLGKKFFSAGTDHLGYFEILGTELNFEKNKNIKLRIYYDKSDIETNVVVGTDDIEWNLPQQRKIVGSVYINDFPATNFSIGLIGEWNANQETRSSFRNNNGNFSMIFPSYYKGDGGKVRAYVTGYAPESIDFSFDNSKICDVGKIIVSDLPADINGRVVNHEGNPIQSWLTLNKINSGKSQRILYLDNDKKTGKFSFMDLPVGIYCVSASSVGTLIKSEQIELLSGESVTIPDLVVYTTNIPLVTFSFLFPDGTAATNVRIYELQETTDENGCIEKRVKAKKYKSWTVNYNNLTYYTEPFMITEDTENIQINFLAPPKITGKVFLDGSPLNKGFFGFHGNNKFSGNAENGFFEVCATPGKYIVSCKDKKLITKTELTEAGANIINFVTENNILEFSFNGNWYLNIQFNKNNMYETYMSENVLGRDFKEIAGLPAGNYKIWMRGFVNGVQTNLFRKATLNNNERKKIVF